MVRSLRRSRPVRTCEKVFTVYKTYKKYLRTDFNKRCGYCDILDKTIGGTKSFHIDHFAPQVPFDHLECSYSNLIYSCPSCNSAKSNKWAMPTESPSHDGIKGYIDPCTTDYDEHLGRNLKGVIVSKSELGEFVRKNLKLYLLKHSIYWKFERIDDLIKEIKKEIDLLDENSAEWVASKGQYFLLLEEFHKYYELITEDN